jgi:membrane protease YdiL (CAAX protease family)
MEMSEPQHVPETPADAAAAAAPHAMTRGRALLEVVLCSSYPTQIAAAAALAAAGLRGVGPGGGLDATFVIAMSIIDAVLVIALILYFLHRRGESFAAVMFGGVPPGREATLGVGLVVPVTLGVALAITGVRAIWPSLQNVPVNPMTALMGDPRLVAVFAGIVVFAGGVREEMQRAFQLHRLAPGVMDRLPALALTSVAFGLGHTVQGRDVAVATFLLGALWGALWLRRRSIVAPAVCHALFNLGQVAAAWAVARGAAGS